MGSSSAAKAGMLQSVRHKISLFSLWQHHKSNAAGSKHMLYPKTLDTNQAKVY
jgi:hypothetical protein